MRRIIFSIFVCFSISTFGQNEVAKMVIAIANKKDTFGIKHFDASGNLVFEKLYPVGYQAASISAYFYDDSNRITKEYFFNMYGQCEITDYEYDGLESVRKSLGYAGEDLFDDFNSEKTFISYLKSVISKIHNIKDLEKSIIFKGFTEKDGHLSEITYFMDTLPIKTIRFKWKGDTSDVINYSYNDQNLLILEDYSKKGGKFSRYETIYTYDTLGRILSKGDYLSTRLLYIFKYYYETPNIIKRTCESHDGKITDIDVSEYKDGKIVKCTNHYKWNKKWKYVVDSYEYDEENRLIREYRSGYNNGKPLTIKYIYITK